MVLHYTTEASDLVSQRQNKQDEVLHLSSSG